MNRRSLGNFRARVSVPGLLFVLIVLAVVPWTSSCGTSHTAPLVLVSFDGFRWDYVARTNTPSFDRLAAEGVHAERMVPVFPSKTFPGHYSVVTGLYPGHHGIISNNMRDPGWPEVFRHAARDEVQKGRWWGGEPIWITARRAGLKTGVYFWPGSEAPIDGIQPDWWFPYDEDVPWDDRVNAALEWLTLPPGERASFVALYFEEPNDSGHTYGPDAPETTEAVVRADAILGRLLDGLAERGLDANVIVVSDHGMAANDVSRLIVLDDYVTLFPDELFEFGAIGQVFPRSGREDEIFEALQGAHPELAVYRRGATPERLHLYDNPRVAPILLVPTAGWEVVPRSRLESGQPVIAGDHGADPTTNPDMHGIFYAAGPGLALGRALGPVAQVDIYDFMCHLLGLEPAPNDGVWNRIAGALR